MAAKTTHRPTPPFLFHGDLQLSTTQAVRIGAKLLPTGPDLDLHLPASVRLQTFPVCWELLYSPYETSPNRRLQNVRAKERQKKPRSLKICYVSQSWASALDVIGLFIFPNGWSGVVTCASHHSSKRRGSPWCRCPDFLTLGFLHFLPNDGTVSSREFEYAFYITHISLLISI